MKKLVPFVLCLRVVLSALGAHGDTFGSYAGDSLGEYPEAGYLQRPYKINFQSNRDGVSDWFTLFIPHDFDPDKIYPVWLKFCPYYGSRSHITGPSHAWNYSDSNDVIVIGCNERSTGDSWLGDNTQLSGTLRTNIPADVIEILNQLFYLFNISYVAASGPSMGGYSSLRIMTRLPSNYVGAVVASCPALWFRWYVDAASDEVEQYVADGHFTDKYVLIMHGTSDDTVPIENSRRLTDAVPDDTWWQLVEIPGGGHSEFFADIDYNRPYPYSEEYGRSLIVTDVWQQIAAWESAHPAITNRALDPLPGWVPPTNWYFTEDIYNARATNAPPGSTNPPSITVQPQSTTVTVGQAATFSVQAAGTAPLAYQWRKNGTNVSIATNSSHTTPATTPADNGAQYRVVVSNAYGIVTSQVAVLTVNTNNSAPVVDAGTNQTITLPAAANLDGTVTDDGLPVGSVVSCQWSVVSGPGTVTFGDSNAVDTTASFPTSGVYILQLTADDGQLTRSDTVQVTVNNTPPPPPSGTVTSVFQKAVSPSAGYTNMLDSTLRQLTGDSFARQSLGKDASMSLRYNDVEGTLILWFDVSSIPTDATIQSAKLKIWHDADEFDVAGNLEVYRLGDPSGTGLWVENNDASTYTENDKGCSRYKRPGVSWTASGGRVTNVISESIKVLAPHAAARADEWLAANVITDLTLFVANPVSNLGWLIQAQSDNTLRGSTYMSDHTNTSKRPILEVIYTAGPPPEPPSITVQPQDATVFEGQTAAFSVEASGDAPLAYQWRRSGTNISGATSSSYTTPTTTLADSGMVFSVFVTNLHGSETSAGATLRVRDILTDSDRDGHTDAQEAITGTDPDDPSDYLRVTCLGNVNPADWMVQWEGVTGRLYDLETTLNLMPAQWTGETGCLDLPGTGGLITITDLAPDTNTYFRVRARLP